MSKAAELARALCAPIAAEYGCGIWDVEYVKEAGSWFLRVYLDKDDGVTIDDCEAVSRALSDKLDEADPIEGSYILEVSSPGADRALKTPEHFARFFGQDVEVRLYRAIDGKKAVTGALTAYENGDVTVETTAGIVTIYKKDVAQVRLAIKF